MAEKVVRGAKMENESLNAVYSRPSPQHARVILVGTASNVRFLARYAKEMNVSADKKERVKSADAFLMA